MARAMRGYIFIILAAIVSLVIAAADNINTFNVHTNDAERFKTFNIKPFIDFVKCEDGKRLSVNGTGLEIAGIYHHRSQKDLLDAAPFLDLDYAHGAGSPMNGTLDRRTSSMLCGTGWCNINRVAQFSFRAGMIKLFNFACGWFPGNLDNDWKTSGATVTVWFNNVMCDHGVVCSMWIGGSVGYPPLDSQESANIFLGNCVKHMTSMFDGCAAANMGGTQTCSVAQPQPLSPFHRGYFTYWFTALPGADWGVACNNRIGWTSLKCGHMTCDATAAVCRWS